MRAIYIDPSYPAYYEDRLFDGNDPVLNRDDTLVPYIRMRQSLVQHGCSIHTADQLFLKIKNESLEKADYYSFGILANYRTLANHPHVRLRAFVVLEPPVVTPQLYCELPALTALFERVYVHNTEGDGYSLNGVDTRRLRPLFWPQPRSKVMETLWQRQPRERRIVVINGNHRPVSPNYELYSERIAVMAELANFGAVDLYGRGWERWWSRNSMWWPYWRNRSTLMSIYKGSCTSKYEVMSCYAFALCFENMAMKGYVTEKIFDCLYTGTVPIYFGAKNIESLLPEECYIDYRNYASVAEMWRYLQTLSVREIDNTRNAGKDFIESDEYVRYYNSLQGILLC